MQSVQSKPSLDANYRTLEKCWLIQLKILAFMESQFEHVADTLVFLFLASCPFFTSLQPLILLSFSVALLRTCFFFSVLVFSGNER